MKNILKEARTPQNPLKQEEWNIQSVEEKSLKCCILWNYPLKVKEKQRFTDKRNW
jgi:hypothetical protein